MKKIYILSICLFIGLGSCKSDDIQNNAISEPISTQTQIVIEKPKKREISLKNAEAQKYSQEFVELFEQANKIKYELRNPNLHGTMSEIMKLIKKQDEMIEKLDSEDAKKLEDFIKGMVDELTKRKVN